MEILNLHSDALCEAMVYISLVKNFFEYLDSDIARLLRGEYKTTDFQWPQFDE